MSFGGIFLLALGLSMDAMAVAATRGLAVERIRLRHVALVATFFGGFQALMPLLGYLLGSSLGPAIEAWDHWVVFVLLGGIGAKMLWEALHHDGTEPKVSETHAFGLRLLLVLAIATSIDALAAGFALPLLGAPLGLSIAVIGVTTAVLSGVGLFAGHRFGAALGTRLDIAGGLMLIALGAKTLIEHLG
jgi:putative Mn2+ efflux pump MntP